MVIVFVFVWWSLSLYMSDGSLTKNRKWMINQPLPYSSWAGNRWRGTPPCQVEKHHFELLKNSIISIWKKWFFSIYAFELQRQPVKNYNLIKVFYEWFTLSYKSIFGRKSFLWLTLWEHENALESKVEIFPTPHYSCMLGWSAPQIWIEIKQRLNLNPLQTRTMEVEISPADSCMLWNVLNLNPFKILKDCSKGNH